MEPAVGDYHNLVVEGERRGGTRGGIHCTARSSGRIDENQLLVEEDKTLAGGVLVGAPGGNSRLWCQESVVDCLDAGCSLVVYWVCQQLSEEVGAVCIFG